MSKKTLLGAALLLASAAASADTYNYLTVTREHAEESISLPTIVRITFEGGSMLVATTGGQYSYPLSEMRRMSFTVEATAIDALPGETSRLKLRDGQLEVSGDGMLRVYDSAGALVQMAYVRKGARVSLSGLKPGLYVVSIGKQTIKITK